MPEYTRLVNRRLVLNIPFTKYKKVPLCQGDSEYGFREM